MSVDANDFLLSSGVKSAAFTTVGDKVTGTIIRPPEVQQQRDFTTGEPKFYSDGNPRRQIRVILATEERDTLDPDDFGERALFIRGNMQKAVATAVRAAGAKGLEVGGKLMVKYTGDGPAAQKGLNPPKLFEAKYRMPEAAPVEVPEPSRQEIADEIPF